MTVSSPALLVLLPRRGLFEKHPQIGADEDVSYETRAAAYNRVGGECIEGRAWGRPDWLCQVSLAVTSSGPELLTLRSRASHQLFKWPHSSRLFFNGYQGESKA